MHTSAHPVRTASAPIAPIAPLQLRAVLTMRAGTCRDLSGQRGLVLALRDTGGLFGDSFSALWMSAEAVAFYELHQQELVAGRCVDITIERVTSEHGTVYARLKGCQLAPLPPSWIKHAGRRLHPVTLDQPPIKSMQHPHIIGLTGPAGSGKDTVALLLATHARFTALAFADALRAEVCKGFRIDLSQLTQRDLKEQPTPALALERCCDYAFIGVMLRRLSACGEHATDSVKAPRSPRQIMQWWGTEYRRDACGDHYWTRTLKARVHSQQQSQIWRQPRHVISDVRFENEAQAIRDMGGVIWQVKRPGLALDLTHSSETDGSAFKPAAVINNRHDLRHLQLLVMGAWLMSETGLDHDDVIGMGAAYAAEAA
jgi:hypothetical protein